ncbi:GreA/GreB family elongation factor [Aureibacter tunicatorum]|uniref:Transcription elongation factor GreA n=1 Tax=Aureibacter tunicatorum TaxID=866807 RepID=A0AAE3XIR6_9BACT|nr:GreA/GreB family elongation factor [Aureibacter tunicatorum]MDR6237587.1 transcription elongation factor GreB [Aureibacter tunicatorum]BDD02621.1 transcription elongation factor GreB [Aureibacter tunicatorum]
MSNYSNLITKEGWDALNAEMEALWSERKQVAEAVGEAAAMGDRSENAEYIYGRKKLRELDGRIGYIHRRFKVLKVAAFENIDQSKVFFSAYVKFKDQTGRPMEFQLVGTDEADIKKKKLSVESPIGKALMDKKIGDTVEVDAPVGKKIFTILAITYK